MYKACEDYYRGRAMKYIASIFYTLIIVGLFNLSYAWNGDEQEHCDSYSSPHSAHMTPSHRS